MIIKCLVIFLILSFSTFAQHSIKGKVVDTDNSPVELATVYINGTTSGVVTDNSGDFVLFVPYYPCELVVSHLNYETTYLPLTENPDSLLKIKTSNKSYEIDSTVVLGNNRREDNLRQFKSSFLGRDYQENRAEIINEDQITFEYEYKTHITKVNKTLPNWYEGYSKSKWEITWSADSSEISYQIPATLKVSCQDPLIINLPKLGYVIHYDLVKFSYTFKNKDGFNECYFLGYSYFKETTSTKKVQRNRSRAYYNSAQHFCKSLYEQKLATNGYRLLQKETGDTLLNVDINPHIKYNGNSASIIGLKSRAFYIVYFSKANGEKIDLNINRPKKYVEQSKLHITSDTCTFMYNGTIPNNNIVFSQSIGSKRVASMVPADFIPYQFK